MKVNEKILSLPPYISTAWIHVKAVHTEQNQLVVTLNDQKTIAIPGLDKEVIAKIFDAHTRHLEQKGAANQPPPLQRMLGLPSMPEATMRLALGDMQGVAIAMEHNSEMSGSPELPAEILEKIVEVTNLLGGQAQEIASKPEPHCNCPHCQIARALQQRGGKKLSNEPQESVEETVTEDDLHFEEWVIEKGKEELYTVTNKLDPVESYQVFLGEPVGCTCGKRGCEHLLAVLKS